MLREESVYKLHPHLEDAAAIMVCDKFAPQWQAWMCNYTKVAEELNLEAAKADTLENRSCRKALRRDEPEALHAGHVASNESELMRWPFLQTLAAKGKKYRLEGPPDTVRHDLRRSLDQYVEWLANSQPNDPVFLRKLIQWADTVQARCSTNWQRLAFKEELLPEGFLALSQQSQ